MGLDGRTGGLQLDQSEQSGEHANSGRGHLQSLEPPGARRRSVRRGLRPFPSRYLLQRSYLFGRRFIPSAFFASLREALTTCPNEGCAAWGFGAFGSVKEGTAGFSKRESRSEERRVGKARW